MSATPHRCTVFSDSGDVLLNVQGRKHHVKTRSTTDVVNLPKLNRSHRWRVEESRTANA